MISDQKCFSMRMRKTLSYLLQNITVEPMMAFYILPSVVSALAVQNLILLKACRVNLQYSETVCDALTARETANYTKEEIRVQQVVAEMSVWKTFLQSVIPALLVIFLGSWCDRNQKRKICMLMPIVGDFVSAIGLIICTYFLYQVSMGVTAFIQVFFPAITGGWVTMFMGTFSHLASITTPETRTARIGAVNIFCSASVPFGTALSGVLIHIVGFYGVFLIAAVGYIISFICGCFLVKENKFQNNSASFNKDNTEKFSSQLDFFQKLNIFLKDLFDIDHIKDTFGLAFNEKSSNKRKRILLLMLVLVVVIGPLHGEMTVMYLFMRYRFNWNEVQFSIFSTYSVIIHFIGTSFSVGVFSHWLKIDDALIGVISCISKILAGFVYAFAQNEWQVYLAPLVDIVNGTSFIAMRSIASKLVPIESQGKLNSLYGVCEALTPLLYGPMYAFLYARTMNTFPGAFFLLGGVLTMPAVIIFGWMYNQHQGDKLHTAKETCIATAVRDKPVAQDLVMTPRTSKT